MEIFIDGGLFELFAIITFGYAMNFIFKRKILLITYCALAATNSIVIIFLQKGFLFDLLVIFNIANVFLLIVLLWREYKSSKGQALIDVWKYREKLPSFIQRLTKGTRYLPTGRQARRKVQARYKVQG